MPLPEPTAHAVRPLSPQYATINIIFTVALERNALEGIEPALGRSKVPMRVVWGMADTVFIPENPDYLDRVFGNSRGVRRLKESMLFWPEERPDILAEEALRLWAV